MDFDPLSFFDADQSRKENVEKIFYKQVPEQKSINVRIERNESSEIILQPLDLPIPSNNPPFDVLKTILLLLMPGSVTNFSQDCNRVFDSDLIDENQIGSLCKYMNHERSSVLTIPQMTLSNSQQLTTYLTRLIAYPFPTYSEDQIDEIYDMASKVMTSYSAPALKGNTNRKIEIGDVKINLYEPAITADRIGNVTWGAAGELAKKIVKDHQNNELKWLKIDNDQCILELGAGTGLVTILLAKFGFNVISTDLPQIVNNLAQNVKLNDIKYSFSVPTDYSSSELPEITTTSKDSVLVTPLDWSNPIPFVENKDVMKYSSGRKFERLLFADPVYSLEHPAWVQLAVKSVLSSKETSPRVIFMLGIRDRFQDVRDDLWNKMRELGLIETTDQVIHGVDDYGLLSYQFKVFEYA